MPTEAKVTRKLRAILSADVKGYSLLMSDDEAFTVKTLKSYRALMSEQIEKNTGRVVDAPGDNLLAEFASVVDAVQCAVEIQKILKEKNEALPIDKRLEFRIGVNIGDVIQDGDSLYGEGVNIAARIEGLADAGGVCISRNAYDHIRNKLNYGYEYLGEHSVKNIKNPVRVYKILMAVEDAGKLIGEKSSPSRKKWPWLAVATVALLIGIIVWQFYYEKLPPIEAASVENMVYPLPDKPSIAVLPFANMSEDPKQEYFSDGITEDIITALSKIPKLFVIARNSTFTYKGKPVKVQQVSEELGVQYVVEGSVRKAEDRVRITAQLIDALSGHHIWAEKYDRNIKNIFAVQDEITKKIITALQIKLTEGEQAGVYSRGTASLEAYLNAMKANWLILNGTKDGVLKALDLAEEAIDLDPNYAFAYKVFGTAHGVTLWLQMSKNPRETLKRTIELHQRSVELNDSLAIAHAGLGYWIMYVRQHDKAVAEGERAFILEPGSADTIHVYAAILTYAGKRKEAIPLFEEALRLNPKPPTVYLRHYGVALRDSGLYKEANAQAERAIKNEPDDLIAWALLVSSLSLSGREEEARAAAKEVMRINPKFSVARIQKITPHKDRAVAKRFGDSMRKAGLPD
jgi:adenylate cyclase